MFSPHRLVRLIIVIIIGLIFVFFVVWEILRVTAAPFLTIVSPSNDLATTSHRITLEGRAGAGAKITANGAIIAVSMDGKFKEVMDLRTGENVITIIASKKFAKPNIIYRRVVVTQ